MVDPVVVCCWIIIVSVVILILYGKLPMYFPTGTKRIFALKPVEDKPNTRVVSAEDKIDPATFEIGNLVPETQNVASACTDKKIDPNKDCYEQLYPINPIYVDYNKTFIPTFAPMPCSFD